jgi:hypothetical protein
VVYSKASVIITNTELTFSAKVELDANFGAVVSYYSDVKLKRIQT